MPELQELGLGAADPRRGERIARMSMDAWVIPLAFVVSAGLTEAAIRYAHARRMLDEPGRRRSHTQVTPRGGGVGIVAAALIVLWLALPLRIQALQAMTALVLVAGIGWWDDHRSLRALWRLLVHILAALVFVAPPTLALFHFMDGTAARLFAVMLGATMLLSVVWSINLHNFLDGINGLLAWQAFWTFAAIGALDHMYFNAGLGWLPFALAAACVAFIPFNFPQARVFMGDVGSGAIGFLIVATIWLAAMSRGPRWLAVGLIVASAAIIDTTATLLSRMLAGRRWYSAHREHLYQWLVRSGRSHARVVGYYMAWNLFIAAPASVFVSRMHRYDAAIGVTVLVYTLGFVVWTRTRSAVLRGVRARD